MKKLRNILFANFLALVAVGSGLFLYWKQESKSESDNTPKPVEVALQLEGGEYKLIRYETENDDINSDFEYVLPPDTIESPEIIYLDKDKKINNIEEYLEYLSGYMFFERTKSEINTHAIMEDPEKGLDSFMDWPYKGEYLNYRMHELFAPGNLIISEYEDGNFIGEKRVEYRYTGIAFEASNVEIDKRVAQRCKELAANITGKTNQEKMANIGVILRNIAVYEKDMFQAEHLLFEGKGNCNAFMEVTDIIARYLGIPCGMVGNREMNHGWDIFIGSDGQIYEIDNTPTWNNNPYLMGNLPDHKQFEEKETELLLLDFDRRMIELHGKVELPPPSAAPIPPKQEEQTPQPSAPPSTEEQDKQPEVKPDPEVKPEPETKPEPEKKPDGETVKKSTGMFTYEEVWVDIGNAWITEKISDDFPIPEILSITSEKEGWLNLTLRTSLNGGFQIRYKGDKDKNWMGLSTSHMGAGEEDKESILFLKSGNTYTVQVRLFRYDIRNGYRAPGDLYSRWSEPIEVTIK